MSLDISKHKNILIKILKEIYTDSSIGPLLGFKGGTAAFLFYNLNRFSVDLDFDLLKPDQEDLILEKMTKILNKYGTIKEARTKRYNILFLLVYDDKEIGGQNIKIEINRRQMPAKYEIKNYLGISMKVMIKDDMFAHKLCAMFERLGKTNRDIFDVYYFFHNNWPVNKEIIKQRTALNYKDFLQHCLSSLEKMSNRNILSGLGELLDEKQKAWVKTKLKSETIFYLKLALQNES